MLRYLAIRHLAVIESVELEFEPGLTVLTGETGAGKSILVEAVGLLLGGRAFADLVRTGEDLATIEAVFEQDGREWILRREVTAQGRSRAFVDGTLVSAGGLRELARGLLELHGQNEHQVLLEPESHLDLLDEYAGLGAAREETGLCFARLETLRAEWRAVVLDEKQKAARADLLTFQRDEIARAAPAPGEDDTLAAERARLANAEKLRRLSAEAYSALYEQDGAVLAGLTSVWRRVGDLATYDARFVPHLDAREAIKSQLEDLADFLRGYADEVDAPPGRLQEVEDRLALLERLKRKHGPTLADVLAYRDACDRELAALAGLDERAAVLARDVSEASGAYRAAAERLSSARRAAAGRFARSLEAVLDDLAMAQTRFEVRFGAPAGEAEWTARGVDRVEFYVSPNPGEELRSLARIASGGELSRIMLGLRTLSAGEGGARTLIFDEVDAGIGGRAADAVGRKLRVLGERHQVLCITHLPQIAAAGTQHFAVAKHVRADRTVTAVRRLDGRAREEELARMMAGGQLTPGVLASAAELLERQAEGDSKAKGESESRAGRAKAKGRA